MYEVYNPQEQTKYVYITQCKFRWFKTRRLRIEQNLVNGLIYIQQSFSWYIRYDKDKIECCGIFCSHRKALKCQKKVLKEIREMVSLSSIFDMDNTTRVLLVSSILRNLLSVGIMQNCGIILTWCFLCLFARTCPNINMTEWLPNLWIF